MTEYRIVEKIYEDESKIYYPEKKCSLFIFNYWMGIFSNGERIYTTDYDDALWWINDNKSNNKLNEKIHYLK